MTVAPSIAVAARPAVVQRCITIERGDLPAIFGVEWLESDVPEGWTRDAARALVFRDIRLAEETARLLDERAFPVLRDVPAHGAEREGRELLRASAAPRAQSFFADWRLRAPNCGVL